MKLGWIGTGNMGVRMAERLVKAGNKIYVYNRTAEKAKRVIDAGNAVNGGSAIQLSSAAEISAECDIIFTSVTNDKALLSILEGESGILSRSHAGQILVEMSTLDPDFCSGIRSRLKEKGIIFLDAPVIGSMYMIEAGLLKVLVSGDKKAFNIVIPFLEQIGRTVIYMGSQSEARYMKIAVNMMICSYLTIFGEVLLAGEGMGFEWNELNDMLENSEGAGPMLKDKGTTLRERIWSSPTALTSTAFKDLSLALACAEKGGFSLPVTSLICQYDRFMHFNPRYETYSTFGTVGVLEDLCGIGPDRHPAMDPDQKERLGRALSITLNGVTCILAGEALTFCDNAGIDRSIAAQCLGTCHGASACFRNNYEALYETEKLPSDLLDSEKLKKAFNTVLDSAMNAGLFIPVIALAAQQISSQ